jgi:hypothetical protein
MVRLKARSTGGLSRNRRMPWPNPAQAALHGAPTSMKVPATRNTPLVEPSGV